MMKPSVAAPEHGSGVSELRRELGLLDSTMINVGTIIGSGIFIVPTTIAQYLNDSFSVIAIWIIGGIISMFGALSVAELGAAMPKAGGQYVYLSRAYGPVWGFLYGWTAFAVINTASIAAVAVAFATYLGFFIPLGAVAIKVIAIVSIILLTAINCLGVKLGAWTQNGFTFLKMAALAAIILFSFALSGGDMANFSPVLPRQSLSSMLGPLGLAMVAVLWSYDGWIEITYVAGEVKNPQKNIPGSLVISTLIVIGLYVLINLAYIFVLSLGEMAHSELVASDTAVKILGHPGAVLVSLAVLLSTFGANNGFILTGARIYYAMAREGLFFNWVGRVDPKFQTPVPSLVSQGLWACLLTLTGTFDQLFTYVVFASWIFYAMSCGAVLLLRQKDPSMPRPYRTWGYPATPLIFIAFALWLVINTIVSDPRDSAIGAGIILMGLPAYFYWKAKNLNTGRSMDG